MNFTSRLKTDTSIVFFIALLFSCGVFTNCKSQTKQAEIIESRIETPIDDAEFEKNFNTVLENYITKLTVVNKDKIKYLSWHGVAQDFYLQNNYTALWVNKAALSSKGKEMLRFIGSVEFLGLNKNLYEYEKLQRIADSLAKIQPTVNFNLSKQLEVGLTRSFLDIALHIDGGMFMDTLSGINANFWTNREKYVQLLQRVGTDSVSTLIASLEPDNPMYNRYRIALKAFVSKNNISSNPIHIRNPKVDSVGAMNDARKALVYHHYLTDSDRNNDRIYLNSLKKFQADNNLKNDGKIGINTIKALERDNSKKFQLLAINADRWRKEHIVALPEKYIWVNLPAYKLKLIVNDTVRLEKKVVIGKGNKKNETPVFGSAITQIILWPTWTVPQSIIKHEMKTFSGFKVTRNGNYITVVQPPGPKNALGCVKILFPNKYSVYMHDTPSKYLFNEDLRAASHGCVRCQDALEVAANLMMMDTFSITYDSLIALKESKVETQIFKLKKSVPVYFRYFTAEADFDGNLMFYEDVYGRDKQMIDFIFNGKQPHVYTKAELQKMQDENSVYNIKKEEVF